MRVDPPGFHPLGNGEGTHLTPMTEAILVIFLSCGLLLPCLWHERVQAGDLSSHVYNAWLAIQIKQGAVDGLTIVPVRTNVLSDWLLEAMVRIGGTVVAERIVVGAEALLFFWGAFYLGVVATGRRPWITAPSLAMLTYGLMLHMGFLNYYVSAGLCLWIVAVLWKPEGWTPWLIALPLAVLAALSHVLPLAWAAAVLSYNWLYRRLAPPWRIWLLPASVVLLLGIRTVLMLNFQTLWSVQQFASLDGIAGLLAVEQVWLYGPKYLLISIALVILWVGLFLGRVDRGSMLEDPVVHLWLLHLAAFVILPAIIWFPAYEQQLGYVSQRISLLTGVFFCLMTGAARHGRGITRISVGVGVVFFTFLYMDSGAFGKTEDQITQLLRQLPPGQSVAASIVDADGRWNALAHTVDRACIGHCFSYSNFEPATTHFRIRLAGSNRVAAPNMDIVREIEEGKHIVLSSEAPMYTVCDCANSEHRFCLRRLSAGEQACRVTVSVAPQLWSPGFLNVLR